MAYLSQSHPLEEQWPCRESSVCRWGPFKSTAEMKGPYPGSFILLVFQELHYGIRNWLWESEPILGACSGRGGNAMTSQVYLGKRWKVVWLSWNGEHFLPLVSWEPWASFAVDLGHRYKAERIGKVSHMWSRSRISAPVSLDYGESLMKMALK